jgi:predicted HicB family RNase H-like nuclease
MLNYKSYTGVIEETDFESGIIFGSIIDISDSLTFQGQTLEEVRKDFEDAVDDYLELCQEMGKDPDKPFSGKLAYRTTSERHRMIAIAAKKAGKSINAWMDDVLAKETEPLTLQSEV